MVPDGSGVRMEHFCEVCSKPVLVRGLQTNLAIDTGMFQNMRSGCCNSYVKTIVRVVDFLDMFKGETYANCTTREP